MEQDPSEDPEKTEIDNFDQFPVDLLRRCWFLAGPTASGKSAAAMHLAQEIQAEIVALDSMTIYKGMDIGTAKPSSLEQQLINHHLLDIIEPHEQYSIARYLSDAKVVCTEIIKRNKSPLFVGGAGLYLRAMLRGMSTGPASDEEFRTRYQQLWIESPETVFAELTLKDPVTAARLHLHDSKRIIRALEVFELTGRPLSDSQDHQAKPVALRTPHVYWIDPPRIWLYERINERVRQMLDHGLINEVRTLLANPQGLSKTAQQGLGYKEVIHYLQVDPDHSNQLHHQKMVNQIQTRTRQFAKRQHTWFRNLEECIPIQIDGTETPAVVCQKIINQANKVVE